MSHQERIGDIVEFKSIRANIKELNQKYRNSKIKIDGKIRWIERITDMGSGFTLTIRDEKGKVSTVLDDLRRPRVYGYEVFKS
jgi:aspartyl-tRNA synthetase